MTRLVLALFVLLVPVTLSAQTDPLWSLDVVRCAIGGQHQDGCPQSAIGCTFASVLAGTCPTTGGTSPSGGTSAPQGEAPLDPVTPQPEPEPTPLAPSISTPVELEDVLVGVRFVHDGLHTDWYTLRINGTYHAHVGMSARIAGVVTIPFAEALPVGTHQATVLACSDALGCVSSPLTLTR